MAPLATSTRKRKTAEEMDESPPKRQTRARAAKTNEGSSTTGPKPTRITTASARIAAEAKAVAAKSASSTATSAASKRKTRTTTKEDADKAKVEAPKIRSRAIKPASEASATKTRTRTIKPTENGAEEKPKLKTRKTKAEMEAEKSAIKPTRTTRARAATMDFEADKPEETKQSIKKVVKRVTFQEDLINDKENKPTAVTQKKELNKTTGIKARPVRKPTVAPSALKGRRAMSKINENLAPLSPKKVTQLAKSTSSSEDELAKTPIKKVLKSATRTTSKAASGRASTPEDILKQSPTGERVVENDMVVLLASPAKRPPPSPFKDSLNQSPKKFPIPTLLKENVSTEASTGLLESLRQSPKKFDFTPMRSVTSDGSKVGEMAKAALLGSPARRPTSSLKIGSVRMAEKISAPELTNTTSISRHVKDNTLFSATPRRLFGSPAKTERVASPVRQPQIVSDDSIELASVVEDPTIAAAHVATPAGFGKYTESARFGEPQQTFQHDIFQDSGNYRSLDAESEDELSLGPLTSSPRKGRLLARRMASSSLAGLTPKSDLKAVDTPRTRTKDQFMTPLAAQLSGWLATSPTREDSEEGASTEVYTPVAEVLHNRNRSRRNTMTPAIKSTYFEDQIPQIDVLATPEEPMQDQDLHAETDLIMADVDIPATGDDIVLATPENELEVAVMVEDGDIVVHESDDVELVPESFDATRGIVDAESAKGSDSDLETATNSVPTTDDSFIEWEVSASPANDVQSLASVELEDQTIIINHSETTSTAEGVFSTNDTSDETPVPSEQVDQVTSIASEGTEPPQPKEFADENVEPANASISIGSEPLVETARCFTTPVRSLRTRTKEVRTVARVPLKAASNDSPMQVKVRKGRSKSMSTPLAELQLSEDLLVSKALGTVSPEEQFNVSSTALRTPRSVSQPFKAQTPPGDEMITLAESPFKSDRSGADANILRGAVVHVDVHTSEGADASGIFVDLLTQMGARCVKQWNWNPRSTIGGGDDLAASGKVGITHVVFKDGSKRTLQKVREAKGLVLCVGVGWVLDCERSNRWLEEGPFAVDTSTIPRGGHNRRKSMEPKMLANLEGNLFTVETPVRATRKSTRLSNTRESLVPISGNSAMDETVLLPFTPGQDPITPKTPFLADEGAKLLQQTCPAKQAQPSLFPLSGNLADQPDENVREKLAKARRRTMGFAPKISSPLGRDV